MVRGIICDQFFAVLNTVRIGRPFSNLVSFAATPDLKRLVFAVKRNADIHKSIEQNEYVSLLIDNRTNTPGDILHATAVTILGTARESTGTANDLGRVLVERIPDLASFVFKPDAVLIEVKVSEYILASFHNSQSIKMMDS
jgi:hypothetical protein